MGGKKGQKTAQNQTQEDTIIDLRNQDKPLQAKLDEQALHLAKLTDQIAKLTDMHIRAQDRANVAMVAQRLQTAIDPDITRRVEAYSTLVGKASVRFVLDFIQQSNLDGLDHNIGTGVVPVAHATSQRYPWGWGDDWQTRIPAQEIIQPKLVRAKEFAMGPVILDALIS